MHECLGVLQNVWHSLGVGDGCRWCCFCMFLLGMLRDRIEHCDPLTITQEGGQTATETSYKAPSQPTKPH